MLLTFSQPVQIEPTDRLLSSLLESGGAAAPASGKQAVRVGAANEALLASERFKGSQDMARLLKAHVQALRLGFVKNVRPVAVRPPLGDLVALDAEEVGRLTAEIPEIPLNEARFRLVEQLLQRVLAVGKFREDIELRTKLRASLVPSVRSAVDRFWPAVDFRRAYVRLLIKETDTIALGVAPDIARQIALNATRGDGAFTGNDLAPLLYLDHLLNTIPTQAFEHCVVDEAQDVSPLEVMLLQKHSSNGSFTIMGDIRQRLLPYRGIGDWREINVLFSPDDLAAFDSNTSYRSTEQITRFTNNILKQVPGGGAPAIPFSRKGDEPLSVPAPDEAVMFQKIAGDIGRLQAKGAASIGVLTKSSRDAQAVYDALKRQRFSDIQLLRPEDAATAGVVVTPILLTKGLEFDAVVLAGVSRENFSGSELDTRLLYLGCTRAKHWLDLHWYGPALPSLAFGKGEVGAMRRRVSRAL